MTTNVAVLGGGLVGGFMAADLAADGAFAVTVFDADPTTVARLERTGLRAVARDLRAPGAIADVVAPFDLVVGALPGWLGYEALRAVIDAGKPCADIGFFPEDARTLDDLARERGVPVVVDCGVAPGICGMVAAHEHAAFDETESLRIEVGGLPFLRRWPFEYRAVFSPRDVIEEYTRPARLVRGGRVVEMPALSAVELVDIPGAGTLESFLTDGLRTLLTLDIPEMEERTLRYPGHAERMRFLREAGFFSPEPIEVEGRAVRPRDVTCAIVFPQWQLEPGEREFTAMRIELVGRRGTTRERVTHDLFVETDGDGVTSMARSTGLPNTIVARMIADGTIDRPGILPPEAIGAEPAWYRAVRAQLDARGITLAESRVALA